jgi:hypothetical protein
VAKLGLLTEGEAFVCGKSVVMCCVKKEKFAAFKSEEIFSDERSRPDQPLIGHSHAEIGAMHHLIG